MHYTNKPTVLIADDEPSMRENLVELLHEEGFTILEAKDGTEAIRIAEQQIPSVILMDIKMPETDGLRALKILKKRHPKIPVIIFTAFGTNENPIEAMKSGAFDYLEKPFDINKLLRVIHNAVNEFNKSNSADGAKNLTDNHTSWSPIEEHIVGRSKKMKSLLKKIGKVANKDATILLQGESGAGKEVFADAIHRHSNRANKPFIKLNCGALPEALLESELFGHEKGAFTGADRKRLGRFELADGGTIFLDEVDALTLPMQVKILRVLQQFTFERIGGQTTLQTDARIIAATNQNLKRKINEGTFREDLFYRLHVIHLNIPPLRRRKSDIEPLAQFFLKKYSPNKDFFISNSAMGQLESYSWPGNVRELENVIQRAIVLASGNTIRNDDLEFITIKSFTNDLTRLTNLSYHEAIEKVEASLIQNALEATNWNKSKAAKKLKINRRLLYSKIDQYKIKRDYKE